jgi:hypothetical protein
VSHSYCHPLCPGFHNLFKFNMVISCLIVSYNPRHMAELISTIFVPPSAISLILHVCNMKHKGHSYTSLGILVGIISLHETMSYERQAPFLYG